MSSVGSARRAAVEVGERARERADAAVLADLELGEVEAEGLDLPDQVLQLAVRDCGRARRGQRGLHQPQVGEQLAGAR